MRYAAPLIALCIFGGIPGIIAAAIVLTLGLGYSVWQKNQA
jgi:hypothetical protein